MGAARPSSLSAAAAADRASEIERTVRIGEAFAREGQALTRRALAGRLVALVGIGAWIVATFTARGDPGGALYYVSLLALFIVIGVAQMLVRGTAYTRDWHKFGFITADVVLLALMLTMPPLWGLSQSSPLSALGGTAFIFFLLALAGTALSNTPQIVLWAGFSIIVAWTVAVLWQGQGIVDMQALWAQVIVVAVVSCLIAFSVARARSLAARQAVVEYERANLSRHFSPNMVERLAGSDAALRAVTAQNVAVLFCDIVGFTSLSQALAPEAVVALLREHFARVEGVIFRHGGTLDKYLGDGVMATFGTPQAGPDDAARALACGRELLTTVAAWNRERAAAGQAPLSIGVGIHYGPVVMGNIGGARRLEFTVIGDTVNIASRIEGMTRDLKCGLLVSDALVAAIRAEGQGNSLTGLTDLGPQPIRGRDGVIRLWGAARSSAAS